ncbi:hypothetical protein Tco_1280202 [Tanacetum coccineum]
MAKQKIILKVTTENDKKSRKAMKIAVGLSGTMFNEVQWRSSCPTGLLTACSGSSCSKGFDSSCSGVAAMS